MVHPAPDGITLETVVTSRVNAWPFDSLDLREFPWMARYKSLSERYTQEMLSIHCDGEPVGAMLLQYEEIPELIFFEVSEFWRGRGVGQAALDILFERLREANYTELIVQTGRPEVYTRMGYQFRHIDQGHISINLFSSRPAHGYDPTLPVCFIYSPKYLLHDYPNHPEHDGRVAFTLTRITKEGLLKNANIISPRLATEDEVLTIHSPELLEHVKQCSLENRRVSPDTPTGPESYNAALLSLGGAILAGELIEKHSLVFVLCRPPGHHAGRDKAGGFCFFNNMAGLAVSLREKGYRPMVVDWDVHHGNGTQEILYELPIMYVSFHQRYLYPNTGSEEELGHGEGLGYTCNFPMPIGADDDIYLEAFRSIHSIADEYKPDVLLISAGQDGHHRDKLSGMRLSSQAFHEMGRIAGQVARQHCEGRLILLLEGGYDLEANSDSLARAIKGILAQALDEQRRSAAQ